MYPIEVNVSEHDACIWLCVCVRVYCTEYHTIIHWAKFKLLIWKMLRVYLCPLFMPLLLEDDGDDNARVRVVVRCERDAIQITYSFAVK